MTKQSTALKKLRELMDVLIVSPADNNLVAYDNASGKFKNQTAAEAGLAAASHTHTASEITDFTEAAQDAVLAVVADSSSIDVTYNDAGNSFSIAVLPAGVDHNSLANLTSGDPHTQYLKTDGSRALGGDQNANSHKIVNLATPTAGTDAATKEYVDASIRGLKWKDNVRVMATGNVDISTGLAAGSVVDGVTLALNDRVALPLQSTGSQRGLYLVPASGAASRTADLAAGVSAAGITFVVEEGTNADKQFVCTNDVGSDVVGTATLAFSQIGGGGTGVTSVALTGTAIFTITGSPITSSGTLDIQFASQTANKFLASPDGSSGALTVRTIVAADLPSSVVLTDGSHAMAADWSMGTHKITNLATPGSSTDAANKSYVDAAVAALKAESTWLDEPCLCMALTNVNLSGGGLANGTTHDGQTVSTGQSVFIGMFQTDPVERGVWVVPASGAATRRADFPAGKVADNVVIKVSRSGSTYGDSVWEQTANGCTVGTDNQTWNRIDSYAGGSGTPGAIAYNYLRNSTFEFMSRQVDPTASYTVSNDVYGPDGWNVLTNATTISVQRVAGTSARYGMQVTQADGSSKKFGLMQILEASDSFQFRGQAVTAAFSGTCSESTKNLRMFMLEWTGTADSPTSDPVNNWSSTNYTGGNFFKSSNFTVVATAQLQCTTGSTKYRGSVTGTISSSCNNLMIGIVAEDSIGSSQPVTFECPGLYVGSTSPTWNCLPAAVEKARCQRFIQSYNPQYIYGNKYYANGVRTNDQGFPVTMRTTPTGYWLGWSSIASSTPSSSQVAVYGRVTDAYLTVSGTPTLNTAFARGTNLWYAYINSSGAWTGTVGELTYFECGSNSIMIFDAEL